MFVSIARTSSSLELTAFNFFSILLFLTRARFCSRPRSTLAPTLGLPRGRGRAFPVVEYWSLCFGFATMVLVVFTEGIAMVSTLISYKHEK